MSEQSKRIFDAIAVFVITALLSTFVAFFSNWLRTPELRIVKGRPYQISALRFQNVTIINQTSKMIDGIVIDIQGILDPAKIISTQPISIGDILPSTGQDQWTLNLSRIRPATVTEIIVPISEGEIRSIWQDTTSDILIYQPDYVPTLWEEALRPILITASTYALTLSLLFYFHEDI